MGQSTEDWRDVIDELPTANTLPISLFSGISNTDSVNLNILNKNVSAVLDDLNEPYILCGLSLGSVLVLQQAIRKKPLLKGIIVSAAQFESPNKILLTIQDLIFRLMPERSYRNMNITKRQIIELVHSLRYLKLKDELSKVTIPSLIICGSKDRINLSASKQLSKIMNQSSLKIIPNGGHELNREQPGEYAKAINEFLVNRKFPVKM
ncbi:alpha/beta hydrolase [Caldifermentibacillus hisashii]|uniref:alpha/beta fold hydrolase n=1 Tax=Caldifermentibacillus hisashii TaxID=996558 RepID=UPI0031FD3008